MNDHQTIGPTFKVSTNVSGQNDAQNLLEVRNLRIEFRTSAGAITANKDLSLVVPRGKTLGIVGEFGSGKSVFCRSILRL